jgi:hypothetical protein
MSMICSIYRCSMNFNELQWISMIFNDLFNGFQWMSLDFNGFQWISMNFNELDRQTGHRSDIEIKVWTKGIQERQTDSPHKRLRALDNTVA